MKTKRQILEAFAEEGHCTSEFCSECPYYAQPWNCIARLAKIGAMAILRQNRKKREFDLNKVLTTTTVDKARIGMKGYFADGVIELRERFAQKKIHTLTRTFGEDHYARFGDELSCSWILFYPIEVEEC